MIGYVVQQSTTAQPLLFYLVLSSDHISPATGKTPTVTISKNGGAFATPAGAVSEVGNGWYKVAGNATDTGTLGPLALHATEASSDPTDCLYNVVAYNPQSATNLGLSNLDAAITSRMATFTLPTNFSSLSIGGTGKVAATMGSTDYTGNTVQTGDSFARIGATGSGLTSLAPASTALSTATWTTVRAGKLDNLDATITSRMASGNVTVGGYAAGQDPATLVLDATASGHNTAGTIGADINLIGTNLDAAVSTRSTDAGIWDLSMTGHTTSGTFGAAMQAAGSAGDPWGTFLPGSYDIGTAGYLVGTYVGQPTAVSGQAPADFLDTIVVETNLNLRQAISILAAGIAGTGGATSGQYAGAGVSTPRISFAASGGERTTVTLSPPA